MSTKTKFTSEQKSSILDNYEQYLIDTLQNTGNYGNIMKFSQEQNISHNNLYRWWNKRLEERGSNHMADYLSPSSLRHSLNSSQRSRQSVASPSRGRPSTDASTVGSPRIGTLHRTPRQRGRGRPPINRALANTQTSNETVISPRRGRGRPSLNRPVAQPQPPVFIQFLKNLVRNFFAWFW